MKGLINIKNNDNECFRWCHIRYLSPQTKDPQRIKKANKDFIKQLNYDGVEFPITEKQYKVKIQNNIDINVFRYEDKQPYPLYVSKEKNKNVLNLLLITKNNKDDEVVNRFMYNQTKHKE